MKKSSCEAKRTDFVHYRNFKRLAISFKYLFTGLSKILLKITASLSITKIRYK